MRAGAWGSERGEEEEKEERNKRIEREREMEKEEEEKQRRDNGMTGAGVRLYHEFQQRGIGGIRLYHNNEN